jgi:hypothetical protein
VTDVSAYNPRRVRVDVPLETTAAFLFVEPRMSSWNPWWTHFWRYLMTIDVPDIAEVDRGVDGRVGSVYFRLPSEDARKLIEVVSSAPQTELAGHRALRRVSESSENALDRWAVRLVI